MKPSPEILLQPIEYLKGVGPQRADLLKKELGVFTYANLLHLFPYKHLDKTTVNKIGALQPGSEWAQVQGRLQHMEIFGEAQSRRLTAYLKDDTGTLEMTWFRSISFVQKLLHEGEHYQAFGKLGFFMGKPQLTHPEIEPLAAAQSSSKRMVPVYSTTEKLKSRGLGGTQLGKLTEALWAMLTPENLPENIPAPLLGKHGLVGRYDAYRSMHYPTSAEEAAKALHRLKYEELFLAQIRLAHTRNTRHRTSRGVVFGKVGDAFNTFYSHHLPFALTGAQKRVLKEIRADCGSGHQMNRLLQGDVGSGKTVVALLAMLIAIDNGYQCCLMAPTEILASQHYDTLTGMLQGMNVPVKLLTGSTKAAERKPLLAALRAGLIPILIGTHALIEDTVQFKSLGLAIVDEQHRFGVEQRARLWKKAPIPPHVLVMTATPIPRTLAMTAYGDLDYSVMDELPPGRLPITTVHRLDDQRPRVMDFLRTEIRAGRQIYIIFPLIEESEALSYENLMQGYENVKAFFPEPKYWISMVHGRQKSDVKETNMQRFVRGDTQIMVSTTVIEVGVNVPNASVMLIESAERFGLSQLHQLRGRVGRGAEKSYCILMTAPKLNPTNRERLKIMCATNNGFEIAEKDLELRGPGDIEGTRQSGQHLLKLANLAEDKDLVEMARADADALITEDPSLQSEAALPLRQYLLSQKSGSGWGKIS